MFNSDNIFYDSVLDPHPLPTDEKIDWRISAYALIRSRENKILSVVPVWNTLWELPGGGINPHESIHEGVIRECYEETGYRARITSEHPLVVEESNFYNLPRKKCLHSVVMVYRAELVSDEQHLEVVDREREIAQIEWVPLAEMNEKNCHRIIWKAIEAEKKIGG